MRLIVGLWMAMCLEGAPVVPTEVLTCVRSAGSGYAIKQTFDPSYLRGDFDGDGKPDYAAIVERGHEQGIVVCRGGAASPVVLGAGVAFHQMRNLDFTAWHVHSKGRPLARGAGARRPPVPAGDALSIEWESASAILYWDGKRLSGISRATSLVSLT